MNLHVTDSISAITVFAQGLLSFFSPCVLPLLPLYLSYLAGGTTKTGPDGVRSYDRVKVAVNTVFFVLGVAFSFFVLGLGLTAVGRFFGGNQLLFARIGGVVVILFGLVQLGVFGRGGLARELRLPVRVDRMAMSPVTALIMGFVFSFAWTPCVGPTLSGVLLMAASASDSARGFALIGVYTLGFVIPFLLAGFFTTSLIALFRKHRGVVRYTTVVSGVLLIFMGVLMVSGGMNRITGYFARISGGSAFEYAAESQESTVSAGGEAAVSAEGAEVSAADRAASGAVTASAKSTESTVTGADSAASAADSAAEVYPAPDFTLTDQYGDTHTLSDYRGKIVFLNFWATWCPPCRAEMPDIQAIFEETLSGEVDDLVVLGVAFPGLGQESDENGISDFLSTNGYTYPVLMDAEASLMDPYYINAYPTTWLIDTEGHIYGYVPGAMSKEMMEDVIAQTRAAGKR